MPEQFSFFSPAYISKSGNKNEPVKVGGCITAEERDADGEILLSKGLDFSYFTGGWGKIKYEHNDSPANFIGAPERIFKKGNEIHFEGELFAFEGMPEDKLTPQQKTAKEAYGLLKAVDDWNKTHPLNQQKVGWSIEGEYLERNKKTGLVSKARITNVVLTAKPKNRATFAVIRKSLEVGYGMSPDTQTGFGATRKESIEMNTKNHLSKENTKMFKSKEEVISACKAKGMSDEQAQAEATKWEQDQKKAPAEKSLGGESFKKAIDTLNEAEGIQVSDEVAKIEESFAKSVPTDGEQEVDLSAYFEAKRTADMSILQNQISLNKKLDLLGKAIGSVVEGLNKSLGNVEHVSTLNARTSLQLLTGKKNQTGLVTDNLEQFQIEDNNNIQKSSDTQLTKSQKTDILFKLWEEGKAPAIMVQRAENGYFDAQAEQLIKSHTESLKK